MKCCKNKKDYWPPFQCSSCNNCSINCCNCFNSDENQRRKNVGEIQPPNDSWSFNNRFKAKSNHKKFLGWRELSLKFVIMNYSGWWKKTTTTIRWFFKLVEWSDYRTTFIKWSRVHQTEAHLDKFFYHTPTWQKGLYFLKRFAYNKLTSKIFELVIWTRFFISCHQTAVAVFGVLSVAMTTYYLSCLKLFTRFSIV